MWFLSACWLSLSLVFCCRVTDINLGKLVRGDAHECFVSPVARAVIELLEKSGKMLLSTNCSLLFIDVCFSKKDLFLKDSDGGRSDHL